MKAKITKLSALLLAALMLVGTFASCAQSTENEETKAETSAGTVAGTVGSGETETEDPDQALKDALADLGEIDYDKQELGIIYAHENEIVGKNEIVDADGGTAQVINDAVYTRNVLLEERCNLVFAPIKADDIGSKVRIEATAPTGDFVFINSSLSNAATSFTVNNFLSNWNALGVDLEGPWWDSGTADFVLNGGVYFMSGSLNFVDDDLTYVLIFNKGMRETYANTVPNPYDTVRNWEWTLDHFNTIIQGVSAEAGDGEWGANDTYGFITTWEFGNTFFLGSDLRYVLNDETVEEPTLFLDEKSQMEKALGVLDTVQSIWHDHHATFMSPPGQEGLGLTAFKEERGLFYSEVVSYLPGLNAEMTGDYGIVPVPKYDKEQEFYRTWTFGSGSTFSIISSIPEKEREVIGQIMMAYAILSHQHIKPAYYDTVLTSRNMRDADSAEMMDLIFANRVYDMAFYFEQLGFSQLFKNCVNDNTDSFASAYEKQAGKKFTRTMASILKNLGEE